MTGTWTHTLLIRNTRAWVQLSYSLCGHEPPYWIKDHLVSTYSQYVVLNSLAISDVEVAMCVAPFTSVTKSKWFCWFPPVMVYINYEIKWKICSSHRHASQVLLMLNSSLWESSIKEFGHQNSETTHPFQDYPCLRQNNGWAVYWPRAVSSPTGLFMVQTKG